MRAPEYLSPSNIRLYFDDPEQWYIRYLSDFKTPNWPQTKPMSIGSAFDAYVKSFLHELLFGKGADPRFQLETIFEAQVEKQNRDWAWEHGRHAFQVYKDLGALSDLMLELQRAVGKPRFEIEIQGVVSGKQTDINGVVLLGKPDVYFRNMAGHSVILDWKVNGWCSRYPTSPAKGYLQIRGDYRKNGHHKDALPMLFQGMMINVNHYLESINEDWAQQLATYGWLCGEEVGTEFITAIDQFACSPSKLGDIYPDIRIAEHRTRVGSDFQWAVFEKYKKVDQVVKTGHVFPELSIDQSMSRCKVLDEKAKMILSMYESGTSEDIAFRQLTGMG